MRPVNLIPKEERPGGRKPLRAGPLAYIVVGALALAVIAVTALVVTENKVSDRKAELGQVKSEKNALQAKATALASYTEFTEARDRRRATIVELADSRFDWERVLTELSLLLPHGIQLTSLSGTVASGVNTAGGGGNELRAEISGPALEIAGCAPSQAAVAGFVEAVKGIDGVTRVGLPNSTVGTGSAAAAGVGSCAAHAAQFQMVAGFDAAPVPAIAGGGEAAAEVTTEVAPETEGSSEESSESPEESPAS